AIANIQIVIAAGAFDARPGHALSSTNRASRLVFVQMSATNKCSICGELLDVRCVGFADCARRTPMAEHQNSQSVEVVAQDADFDISESTALTQPYSQDEIEDLLYSAELSVEDRITRLRAIRDEMVVRESGDFVEQDPADMIS